MKVCRRGHAHDDVQCRECVKIKNAAYHRKHAAEICEKKRLQRLADPASKRKAENKWRLSNLEKKRAALNRYFRGNRDVFRANAAKRRSRIMGGGGSYTKAEVADLLKRQGFKCAACFANIRENNHADHIIPVRLGGSSFIENIQMLCPTCNISKGARDPIVWAQQMGRLL